MTDIDTIFEKSWTNHEILVAKKFKACWWDMQTNQHFLDPFTWIPREIDIIATKSCEVWANYNHFNFKPVPFQMRVFAECKYLKDMVWLHVREARKDNLEKAFMLINTNHKLYLQYLRDYWRIPEDLRNHRYFSCDIVAYQSTDNNERWFWMQWIKQVIHWMTSETFKNSRWYSIDYPIIAVSDYQKIAIDNDKTNTKYILDKPIFFEIDYVDKENNPSYFLVDIISLDSIDSFINNLEEEFVKNRELIFKHELHRQMERANTQKIQQRGRNF